MQAGDEDEDEDEGEDKRDADRSHREGSCPFHAYRYCAEMGVVTHAISLLSWRPVSSVSLYALLPSRIVRALRGRLRPQNGITGHPVWRVAAPPRPL
jgi:hypothetical protein